MRNLGIFVAALLLVVVIENVFLYKHVKDLKIKPGFTVALLPKPTPEPKIPYVDCKGTTYHVNDARTCFLIVTKNKNATDEEKIDIISKWHVSYLRKKIYYEMATTGITFISGDIEYKPVPIRTI